MFHFELLHVDPTCAARRSTYRTPHGVVECPAFMPVGTQGTVKGLTVDMLRSTGSQMVLGNTYHLMLRPGEQVIEALGGLHRFMGWDGPILTDSGGFQLFSLARISQVTDQSALFRSHIDGRLVELSPERAVQIQESLGSDVAMVLDDVVRLPSDIDAVRIACERTIRWAERCRQAATRRDQAQFGIVQGGLDPGLRVACAERLLEFDFPGYAIGGLSVGEATDETRQVLQAICPVLPADKPRYLMGMGRPRDLLEGIRHGVDLFDCVMPTRNGRNALAFTDSGPRRIRNQKYQTDNEPLDPDCPCAACRHSRGYLRHLFVAGEMLGPILVSHHNLTYYQRLLSRAREAIVAGRFMDFYQERCAGWGESNPLSNRPNEDRTVG